jgi:hypothetical protein
VAAASLVTGRFLLGRNRPPPDEQADTFAEAATRPFPVRCPLT